MYRRRCAGEDNRTQPHKKVCPRFHRGSIIHDNDKESNRRITVFLTWTLLVDRESRARRRRQMWISNLETSSRCEPARPVSRNLSSLSVCPTGSGFSFSSAPQQRHLRPSNAAVHPSLAIVIVEIESASRLSQPTR